MSEMDTQAPVTDTTAPEGNDFESMAIPETFKDSPIGKYSTVGELAKGYSEAQKLIGAKGVIVPGEKAAPEEYDKFYNAIGRPDKPEGYKFSPIEGLHPEVNVTPEAEADFRAYIHKHGIPQRVADGMRKDYLETISNSLKRRDETTQANRHKAETELRRDWGPDYNTRLSQAQQIIDKYGGPEARAAFGELGNNPAVLKTLGNIAKHFNEDTFVKGGSVKPDSENALKLKNIMLDKKHPYWVEGPGHDEAVKEVIALQESITPNERVATRE